MFAIIGMVVVIGAVLGGYAAPGGHLDVLWQPFEFVIIFGAGVGAFLITNPPAGRQRRRQSLRHGDQGGQI